MSAERHRCSGKAEEGYTGHSHGCEINAKLFEEEKWWCHHHAPSTLKAKWIKRMRNWGDWKNMTDEEVSSWYDAHHQETSY